jgi:hypothetical protein
MPRIKFKKDNVKFGTRIHAKGDVIEVDEIHADRLIEHNAAEETDDEPTQFPEPEVLEEVLPPTPEGNKGGTAKSRR